MFLTIIVITSLLSLRIGNAELFGKEDNDFFNNDMYMKTNKYEKSEKHQYIGNINENDIIKDISKFFDYLSINQLGKRKPRKLDWWQKSVFYEIYPRSFKDTTGNGIGDLRGVIENIPYLKDLGIGAVWLTPIYPSPGFDLGYDITDFIGIDPLMGSMDDFDDLLNKLHENGIKLLMDFVPNHTSHKHEWFIKSVQKIEPFTDYYVWANAKYINGTRQPPNNWLAFDGPCMWTWNEQRNQYYLHQFHKEQPDLNFWNPLVREEIKSILRFWLDKGVDGFRLDAITHLYEKQDLMDMKNPMDKNERYGVVSSLNETFSELSIWRSIVDEYKQKDGQTRVLISETYENIEKAMKYYGNSTHPGSHFILNAYLISLRQESVSMYIELISQILAEYSSDKWPNWTIGNHDRPRATSAYGDELLDGICMIQLLLPGTPVVYYGDELGMTNTHLREDQIIDSKSKRLGVSKAREMSRTPLQWNSKAQAGFSNKTKTWLPVNPNYVNLNVKNQYCSTTRSHLNIFKQLVELRQLEVFRSGDVNLYEVSKYVLAFSRSSSIFKSYFVVINMGSELENINLRKVKRFLPSKMTVRVASVTAEQLTGDVIETESFTLRPSASLVLESSFF
ncbi:maltase A3-like [Sipha flava]|uniref:alpha-glucosidase n=4 Tax=Sipha flava TaxID=143950 RepID=A0A8B8GGB4_9HEMI|nr:maltase A3-like [Sipha flava]